MFEYIAELLQLPFVQRMFIATFLSSIVCGVIGTYVVVKRLVFVSGGIAHTTFGGIGFAYFLQSYLGWMWFEPMFGALLFAIVSATILSFPSFRKKFREDSTIGAIWVIGMALGVLFLNLVDKNKILVQDPMSILFGNILLIKMQDLYIMTGLVIAIIIIIIFLYKDFQILTFDEEFGRISGMNADILYMLLLILIAFTTVVLIKVVGVVLVIAMLTIPAAVSGLFTCNLKKMMIFAIILGIVTSFTGTILSLEFDLPPGSTIVILLGGLFAVSLLLSHFKDFAYQKSGN